MAREMKSPAYCVPIEMRDSEQLYRLYLKIWQVAEDGKYHSPREEELGIFIKAKPGEPYEQAITTYDPARGPKTTRFRKLNPQKKD